MPEIPKTTISKTSFKHYNEFRNVRTEALRWVKIITDTVIKFKFETSSKEIDQNLF